jgi:hypothetical protein
MNILDVFICDMINFICDYKWPIIIIFALFITGIFCSIAGIKNENEGLAKCGAKLILAAIILIVVFIAVLMSCGLV